MITNMILNIIVLILGALFSWLPLVTKLPSVGNFDLDSALINGVGQFQTFVNVFWPIKYMFEGFLILMAYYAIKAVIRFIIGHRAPQ